MNLALLDPSTQDFPEVIEEFLEDGIAVTSAFNRRGSLLAVGCNDGRVVIWDFDTHGIARSLISHVQTVTSVSWSRNGRRLLSASTDWNVILWDVLSGDKLAQYRFDGPVMLAKIHPRNNSCLLISPLHSGPCLVDATKPDRAEATTPLPLAEGEGAKREQGIVAVFNKRGEQIVTGNSAGSIIVIDTKSLEVKSSLQVSTGTGSAIKSICFSREGDAFIVNSADRNIRVYNAEHLHMEHKFQDLVNRVQWKTTCFSANADYIVAGSAQEAQHHIYIWDRVRGNLLRILEGPKEGLLDVVWHPVRPMIASISTFGVIYIWSVNYTENWSAFAPDFKELGENVEYIEREDEFDEVDETVVKQPQERVEDEDIDILTVERVAFGSSDEEPFSEDELIYLPTHPIDDADMKEEEAPKPSSSSKKRSANAPKEPSAKRSKQSKGKRRAKPKKSAAGPAEAEPSVAAQPAKPTDPAVPEATQPTAPSAAPSTAPAAMETEAPLVQAGVAPATGAAP